MLLPLKIPVAIISQMNYLALAPRESACGLSFLSQGAVTVTGGDPRVWTALTPGGGVMKHIGPERFEVQSRVVGTLNLHVGLSRLARSRNI